MKKIVLCVLVLLTLLSGLAYAQTEEEPVTDPFPEMGLTFTYTPERFAALFERYLLVNDAWEETEGELHYARVGAYWASEEVIASIETLDDVYAKALLVYQLVVVQEDRAADYTVPPEATLLEMSRADGYVYQCLSYAVENPDLDPILTLMQADGADPLSWIETYAPTASSETPVLEPMPLDGAKDLFDREVPADLYAQSRLTMVNVWATFCSPCVDEMPHLAEISAEYDTERFQIVGVVSDVTPDGSATAQSNLALAQRIATQTGADYLHLLPTNDMIYGPLSAMPYVPTTLFVDAQGQLIGNAVVGSLSKAKWIQIIEERLAMVE